HRPPAEVGRRAPQAADRLGAVALERSLRPERAGVWVDVVAAGGRVGGAPGRAPKPAGADQALVDEGGEGCARHTRDELPEQGVGEVGVMPALARRQYELGVAEAFDHLRAAREPERLPDLARRLPLEARAVGQQPADGQVAEPRLRQVPLEWVVERDV